MEPQARIEQRPATTVLTKRFRVRLSGIGEAMSGAFGEVYRHIGARGVTPAGPPFVIYPEMPSQEEPFDIEVCAPVPGPMEAPVGWELSELPGSRVATLVHLGPYDTVGASYEALSTWIATQGLSPAGPPREIYLSPPETPPEKIQTVIEFPVEDAVPVAGAPDRSH
jgi:effector-binding domain-containing protein